MGKLNQCTNRKQLKIEQSVIAKENEKGKYRNLLPTASKLNVYTLEASI